MKTNNRYRYKYKFFLRLRTGINKKILRFGKKKWMGLKRFLGRKRFRFYDHSVNRLSKYAKALKKLYRFRLITKQKLKSYYGRLSNKQLKRFCQKAGGANSNKSKNVNKENVLLILLEKRLEVVIFRAHFTASVQSARQLITHGNILVNGKRVFNGNIIINQGDLIGVSSNINDIIKKNVFKSMLRPAPPSHLEVNYKILNIFLVGGIYTKKLSGFFPFWLDIGSVLSYHKK
jgi:small subunit ribosomal protein S4